jgi:hypothetical protein
MSSQSFVSDTFALSGDHLDRLRQALDLVAHQARLAQSAGFGRNVDDALTDIEELARDQLARIGNAMADDVAEVENQGDAGRAHRAWHPLHRAA